MARLKVAVVGLGVGMEHIAGYRRRRECEVALLCDLSPEKLARAKKTVPRARLTRRFADILRDPSIDVVSIASYDDAHAEQVTAALEAGKHVFAEKPLCRTLPELRRIRTVWARRAGRLKLASNLVLRAAPLYQWLRREIRAGTFGRLYAVDGEYLYGRVEKITRGWRKDVRDYSVLEGGGVHLIDLFLWLTGEKPTGVFSLGNRIATQGTAFRYNDYAAAIWKTRSGLIGRVTANFACVHPHQHVLRVFGTKASFLYDDAGARWTRRRDRAPRRVALPSLPRGKGDLIPGFVEDILKKRDTRAATESCFDAIRLCAAADRSAATGRPERMPL